MYPVSKYWRERNSKIKYSHNDVSLIFFALWLQTEDNMAHLKRKRWFLKGAELQWIIWCGSLTWKRSSRKMEGRLWLTVHTRYSSCVILSSWSTSWVFSIVSAKLSGVRSSNPSEPCKWEESKFAPLGGRWYTHASDWSSPAAQGFCFPCAQPSWLLSCPPVPSDWASHPGHCRRFWSRLERKREIFHEPFNNWGVWG